MAFTIGTVESMGISGVKLIANTLSEVSGPTHTFSSVDLGPIHPDREIFLAFVTYQGLVTPSPTSSIKISVGEYDVAEKTHLTNTTTSYGTTITIARIANLPLTSANITYTADNTITVCSLFAYRVVRKTLGNRSDSQGYNGTGTATNYTTAATTIQPGGISIGVGKISEGSTGLYTTNVTVSGGGAVKTAEQDSIADVPMTNYSWCVDRTNESAVYTPSVTHTWANVQYYMIYSASW